MKVALVHELLTMRGGAERVLRVLADMYPDAPIYTLLYDEQKLGEWFPKDRVVTSKLQKWAWLSTNHHLYLKHFPAAVEAWDFSDFELVISSSSAFTHGIITNGQPKHLCYVQSPARYLWDRTHDVQERAGHGLFGRLKRWYLSRTFHRLRIWDSEAADRPDALLAPSKEVQRRIELYWRRESTVVHPPIDDAWLEQKPEARDQKPALYFLIVSTLADYKRIDLAIAACNQLKLPLKIVGEGPALPALKRLAGPTIEFLGYRSHEELRNLYANATATLFPGEEDFGLVPLESMACGTPVIAYGRGGAKETVIPKTGIFFDEPTAESLAHAIYTFDRSLFDPATLHAHAKEFSRKKFEEAIKQEVKNTMK